MNAIATQKTQLAEALLSEPARPETAWAEKFRADARQRFLEMGAPIRRDEYWKYTDPARLTRPMAPVAESASKPGAVAAFGEVDALDVVFVNGRFRADLSDDLTLDGVELQPLSLAMASEGWAAGKLGALEAEGQAPVHRPLAALNGALATDGLVIRATGAAARPIRIRYENDGEGAAYLRHLVEVAEGASVTILEAGACGKRHNTVMEAEIADRGALHHVREQTTTATDQLATALFVKLGAEAVVKSFTLTAALDAAPRLARNEAMIWLEGDEGSAHLAGGVLGQGKAHIDNTVFLTHDALNCESRQVYKNVLAEDARGVFQGKILVKPGAQKTDGYQISQSILLDPTAEFDAKPELEIYADDVKCSHGSTSGALEESLMFYLRSRGLNERAAQAMLVGAFIEEAIVEIDDETLQDAMRGVVERWMAGRVG